MLALLWLVPAAGNLITSVRTPDAVNNSGWLTVFRLPPDFSQFSFASYRQAFYGTPSPSCGSQAATCCSR